MAGPKSPPSETTILRDGTFGALHPPLAWKNEPMPFEFQPRLVGSLVQLRPLEEQDFEALYAVASDPLLWEQHPNKDRHQIEVFRDFFQAALDSEGAFAVIDNQTGEVIGSSRYHGYDEEGSEIEVGFTFLARKYWGGVYNREMKKLMLDHAFTFVNSVIFAIGPDNWRSRKAVEKVGAVFVEEVTEGPRGHRVVYRFSKP
jgi:RimJ/RimL family protein N-acetyltransferase